ncbi:hypothetical protein PoB_005274200 [Plakobranchus ocellatus]|uniref:Uncharacterized protein n=1 Tax=Plakobranchus ocellatus TaxID=259542 RepID=A0AAV4C4L0_9GAST|nr:hypothetical protein PoB_005274200 [Plakobranchus ocellatus]
MTGRCRAVFSVFSRGKAKVGSSLRQDGGVEEGDRLGCSRSVDRFGCLAPDLLAYPRLRVSCRCVARRQVYSDERQPRSCLFEARKMGILSCLGFDKLLFTVVLWVAVADSLKSLLVCPMPKTSKQRAQVRRNVDPLQPGRKYSGVSLFQAQFNNMGHSRESLPPWVFFGKKRARREKEIKKKRDTTD